MITEETAVAPPHPADGPRSPGNHEATAGGPISTTLLGLHFVGRGEEAFTIACTSIETKLAYADRCNGGSNPLALATCGQMLGDGKSQMGMQAIARANAPDVKKRLRAKFLLAAQRKNTSATESGSVDSYLATALRLAIKGASEQEGCAALGILEWDGVPDTERCDDILARVYDHTGRAVFVHWDGVERIEALTKVFPADSAMPHDTPLQATLRRFYRPFWHALLPLLTQPHMFTLVTGKTQAFGLIHQQLLAGDCTPSLLREVPLCGLSLADLETAIRLSTTLTGTPLTHWLRFASEELRAHFMRRLEAETAGHPRLVHTYLEGMIPWLHERRLAPDIATGELVEELMRVGDAYANKKLKLATYAPRGTGPVLSALIMAALLGVSLPVTDVWLEGTYLPLLALIDRFNLYAYKADRQEKHTYPTYICLHVRIRIADCLLRCAQAADLCPGLPIGRIPLSLLCKGDPLELLLRLRLINVLSSTQRDPSSATTWSVVVPAFASTLVGSQPVASVAPSSVYCIPQIVTDDGRESCGVPAAAHCAWEAPMHVKHLGAFLARADLLPENAVGYAAHGSHSPEVFLRLKEVLVGFVCRLGNARMTWAAVQDEIDKAEPLVAASQGRVCLVIAALALDKGFRGKRLRWVVQADNTHAMLKVPARMQVVILSQAGLCSLLGANSVYTTAALARRRDSSVASAELSEVFMAMFGITMPGPPYRGGW